MYEDLLAKAEWEDVEVPAQRETFEAQVLIMTRVYKKQRIKSALYIDIDTPLSQAYRVLQSGKYHLELVQSSSVNGKPTLIIYEDEAEEMLPSLVQEQAE